MTPELLMGLGLLGGLFLAAVFLSVVAKVANRMGKGR